MIMPYLINKINISNISNTGLATSLLLVGYNLVVFITPYGSMILEYIAGDMSLHDVSYVDASLLLFHVYPNLNHGFGLGIGTSIEAWIYDVINF